MKASSTHIVRLTCAILALGLFTACSRQVTVKIGVVGPMTGPLAAFGKDMAKGSEIAMDELNTDTFMINSLLVVSDSRTVAERASPVASIQPATART